MEARVPGPGQSLDYEAQGPDGHPLKVLARSSVVQGRPVTLLVAEDMSLARQEIWETGLVSLAVFAPLLALALLLITFAWQMLGAGTVAVAWQEMLAKIIPLEYRGRLLGTANFGGTAMGTLGAAVAAWILAS